MATQDAKDWQRTLESIVDPLIRTGVREAIEKTLLPAKRERAFPGHFMVEADGGHFGTDTAFPGLDGWQTAGAYLLIGETRTVLDYFDFVKASQRADGHIPFAVFSAEKPLDKRNHLRSMRDPEDVFYFRPLPREGRLPESDLSERRWVGLFEHWVPTDPLGALGPVSHVLLAGEIAGATGDAAWLRDNIDSVDRAAAYLLSRKSENGLIPGAGFYVELPSRYEWDGVAQCYIVHAFRTLSDLHHQLENEERARFWSGEAERLAEHFQSLFWVGDHYGEYIHPVHGLVDFHGLTDVNWAAIAFGIADERQAGPLWERMKREKRLWRGDVPSQSVAVHYMFQPWEFHKRFAFEKDHSPIHDVAAMGRVWFLEAMAALRMGDAERLVRSVELVCRLGEKDGWYWRERYHPMSSWQVDPGGTYKYCEYPAILTRVVLGRPDLFS